MKTTSLLSPGRIAGLRSCLVFIRGYTFPSPYPDQETLERIAFDRRYVHWKVARFFALHALDDFRVDNGWENTWLSEYPLLIYHGDTPRYYEFRVLRDGTEIGAITGVVEKAEGMPIQFVLPFAQKIAGENAWAIRQGSKRLLDTAYPGRLLMELDVATEDTRVYPSSMKGVDFLEAASQDQLETVGISTEALRQQYRSAEQEKVRELAVFWEGVDELTGTILGMSEAELRTTFGDTQGRGGSPSSSDTYLLHDWYCKETWADYPVYCGPNVIAFTLLGLGTTSGYPGIPTANNTFQLQAYYRAVESRMGKGPKLYYWFKGDSLDGWLRTLTGDRYSLGVHWDHTWGGINRSIRGNNLPLISLRWPKIESFTGGFHYRAIIGTRKTNTSLSLKLGWWTVRVPPWAEGQYRMHDNGADHRNWWEGPSLYHFQAARVVNH